MMMRATMIIPRFSKFESIASYTLYTLVDTLRISPEVSPADAEYDFHWGVYQTNVQGYAPTLDTIATTRDLVYPMTLDPGSYKIVCMATERNTGITEIKEVPLTVTTALSEGWYVLRLYRPGFVFYGKR